MARVNAGVDGVWYDSGESAHGKIYCAKAPVKGVEQRLLSILEVMVDTLNFSIVLSSVDTGVHAKGSRHYSGRAVDVSDVHEYGEGPAPVTPTNPHAQKAFAWLVDYGFKPGREAGPYDAVLYGPVGSRGNLTRSDHSDHMHISIRPKAPK